ncbi:hypothetical protein C8255_13790 [filamentous cyanobacterium CCP3]|nr:hypothetical protein C8255_13790 [filamentous cyanobacterium CCP3]
MARQKRSSQALEKARRRIAGMQSVIQAIDFGNGYTMTGYEEHIQDMHEKLMAYNRMLPMVDGAYNDMLMAERKLMDFSDHMLSGFGVRYGKDSSEYEMAGGRRKSERQKRTRRPADSADVA